MVIAMILAFNLSWTPYAVVCTLKLFNPYLVPDAWAVPGLLLAKRYFLLKIFCSNYPCILINTFT